MSRFLDYVIAVVIFIIGVTAMFQIVSGYADRAMSDADLVTIRSNSEYLYNIVNSHESSETGVDDLWLLGDSYQFEVVANNTQSFYRIHGSPLVDLSDEIVSFDMSSVGSFDENSVSIFDSDNGEELFYSRSGNIYYFSTDIPSGSSKVFLVFFDRTSDFSSRSASISGADNITEKMYYPKSIDVLQYDRMQHVALINYSDIRGDLRFNISISYLDGVVFWSYGESLARNKNVVSLERLVIFQDSDGSVVRGRLNVNAW
ncbi:MAG: hypothetical protein ABIA21_01490 [Candidatus Aenigmatarchaeota archaeon]